MDWITQSAALGSIDDLADAVAFPVVGVLSLIQLPQGLSVPPEIDHLVVPLADGSANDSSDIRRAVAFACDFLRDDEPLFVHCHAGRSRSVVIMAMALMRHLEIPRSTALAMIGRKRAIALTPGIEMMFRIGS